MANNRTDGTYSHAIQTSKSFLNAKKKTYQRYHQTRYYSVNRIHKTINDASMEKESHIKR